MRARLLPALLTLVVLAGCSGQVVGQASPAPTTTTSSGVPTGTTPVPSTTVPSAPATATVPAQVLDAGTVADGADGAVSGELVVLAEGPWTSAIGSWDDLPLSTGPQTITGSAVSYLGDQVPVFRVDHTPAGPHDSFSGRILSATEGESLVSGNSEAFTDSDDVPLPGVLAVQSQGTWTVTPGG